MSQTQNKKKKAQKLYVLVIQRRDGAVHQVITNYDFGSLVIEAMDLAKEANGFWTIMDTTGKYMDGNFDAELIRQKELQK